MYADTRVWQLILAVVFVMNSAITSLAKNGDQADLDESLISCVRGGEIERVRELLKRGASPDASNSSNRTALQYAAGHETTELLNVLINAGADINTKDKSGGSPLVEAVANRSTAATLLLLSKGAKPGVQDLRQACWLGRKETVIILLDAGANANGGLFQAAQGGHLEITKLLLDQGADVNATSLSGSTALHAGALQGGIKTVEFLLDKGANPNALNEQMQTPLHRAISGDCDLDTIKLLVKSGARLDLGDEGGVTPVRLAAINGAKPAYDWLLAANDGKEPRPQPLPLASAEHEVSSIDELLEKLSSPNLEDRLNSQRQLVVRGKKIIPEILRRIESGSPLERYLELFTVMGVEAEAVLPTLAGKLDEKKYVVVAHLTMERIKPGHFKSLPLSVRKQADEALYQALIDPEQQEISWYFIGWLSDDYQQKLIRSTNPKNRVLGVESVLSSGDSPSAETEALLIKLLLSEAETFVVRQGAIHALATSKSLSREATEARQDFRGPSPRPNRTRGQTRTACVEGKQGNGASEGASVR